MEGIYSIASGVLAGIDFFTVEILTWRGVVTYYVLFFIHLESRRVSPAGITRKPGPGMDATDGAQRDWGGVGLPGSAALRIA